MSIYQELKKLQKDPDKSGYVTFYFYRKISIFLSIIFIKLKIHQNLITILSMLSDFLVIYVMSLQHWILAGILVNLGAILDRCDGEVARYYKLEEKQGKREKTKDIKYGAYLDVVLGIIGFSLIMFFAGYFMGSWQIGVFVMFGFFMVLISSLASTVEFPDKKKIARKFEEGLLGKIKGRIGFTSGLQRVLISLIIIFSSLWALFAFGILCYAFFILRFWVYRKH